MSGLTLVGGALMVGGIVTAVLSRAMSQRTREGAYVDAMLTAYRRTLAKTLALANSMEQVVAEPTVATLADTPDRAVVWGIALGLHDEVSDLLARSLVGATATAAATTPYFPTWLGSTGGPASNASSAGSLFSGGGIPDFGGMFNALTNVGNTPPSHSSSSGSSGGSFGGGSSSGGSGGSTGF
jgi:hypothetical protein